MLVDGCASESLVMFENIRYKVCLKTNPIFSNITRNQQDWKTLGLSDLQPGTADLSRIPAGRTKSLHEERCFFQSWVTCMTKNEVEFAQKLCKNYCFFITCKITKTTKQSLNFTEVIQLKFVYRRDTCLYRRCEFLVMRSKVEVAVQSRIM